MKFNGGLILFTAILVAITTACKFWFGPDLDWSGFSPVIAIALFSGMIIRQKDMSFILPLLAVLISDCLIQFYYEQQLFPYPGFYSGQWKNYLILMSATLIGWALRGKNFRNLAIGGLVAPTVFFLISNFNVWLVTTEVAYPKTFEGLVSCYVAGLPFYRNALIATLVFLPSIMFLYNYLTRRKVQVTLA